MIEWLIESLQKVWQNSEGTNAKFCAQWDIDEWAEFILACESKGLDIDDECKRLYEEQGDF